MSISKDGILLIKHFESLHDGDLTKIGLQPKMCPAGIWTEGYGHAMIYNGKFLKGAENKPLAYQIASVSKESDAESLLVKDLKDTEELIDKILKVKLTENKYDALVSHVFNCGISETLFKLINSGNYSSTDLEMWWTKKYISANGKVLNGLVRRRMAEWILFSTGKLQL